MEKISTIPTKDGQASATDRWSICVRPRHPRLDVHGRNVLADVRQVGIDTVEAVHTSRIYLLKGRLSERHVCLLAEELLADPVCEGFSVYESFSHREGDGPALEIHFLAGVMNPLALSTQDAAARLFDAAGFDDARVDEVQTARRYEFVGPCDAADLQRIATAVLANDCIETWYIRTGERRDQIPEDFPTPPTRPFAIREIHLHGLNDEELMRLSREGHLFLSLEEMHAIRDHFEKLGRDPTDLELETFAQTWSEHCVHKTLKSAIEYRGTDCGKPGEVQLRFDNLLKETIVAATQKLDRDWCLSVFVDNAGVVAFDDEFGLAFKVETHNHPSAIEPYGGAATGVGGCIRDIMGCGLGAKPIASTDVFCLAPPDWDSAKLPAGVLHPRRVLKGVVAGVRDYGNRMGIPTVNGAVYFDQRFLANPLVFCGCVGLVPRDRVQKGARPGDKIVLAGGRTGRDGIHGATFSSSELTDAHAEEFSHAVQIGHAIEEKKLLDALLIARDHAGGCLYSSVTDCGAGGLSSAVGEMAAKIGATVNLENVPLKYSGLRYDEIWISEAQERMVFAVPPDRVQRFLEVFAAEEVEANVIGEFTDDRVLRVRYDGRMVGELDLHFLHEGLPKRTLRAAWTGPSCKKKVEGRKSKVEGRRSKVEGRRSKVESRTSKRAADARPLHAVSRVSPRGRSSQISDTTSGSSTPTVATIDSVRQSADEQLLAALSDWNVASKEWIIRQYDHEVQGRSVIKPLMGCGAGPSDAAVLRPRYDSDRGVAVGCGLCPDLSEVDPYFMAVAAVDEALRNVTCVGADPQRTAILDNFCWPKVDTEESLGALVRTCRGAYDAAVAFELPFISGKDSLNNEFSMSADESARTGLPQRLAIPYTLLISALGIVPDVRRCVTIDLKEPGNCIVLASEAAIPSRTRLIDAYLRFEPSRDRRGADKSDEATKRRSDKDVGRALPAELNLDAACTMHHCVANLIHAGKVRAAHDVSDGGLAVTIAEMCIASDLGATVHLKANVFAESIFEPLATTYVLEMTPTEAEASGLPIIGRVERKPRLRIESPSHNPIDLPVDQLAAAWRRPLSKGGGRAT